MGSGGLALERLADESDRQRRSIESEDAAARKAMNWPEVDEASDMNRQMVFGDVNYPQPPKRSGMGPLAAALLGAAIPGAGIGGMLLNEYLSDTPPAVQPPGDDETISLGLGREAAVDE